MTRDDYFGFSLAALSMLLITIAAWPMILTCWKYRRDRFPAFFGWWDRRRPQ